ncbi:MAG TPA: hypothetical protein ACQGQF_07020 [Xylella fastidiosa subsp. pauca]
MNNYARPLGDDVREASKVIVRKVVRWLADGFTEGAALKRWPPCIEYPIHCLSL